MPLDAPLPTTSAPAPVSATAEPGRPPPSHGHWASAALVPIRSIGRAHAQRILAHLQDLGPEDRFLRFGYMATDEHIERYVAGINFEQDELFGIFNRNLDLIAMAHLAFSTDAKCSNCAEFGVSVAVSRRARGYGERLFERAVMRARNEGVSLLFIHALSQNKAMLRIAQKAGALIERDGPQSEAHLRLPPADFDSRVTELFNEQVARTDYHLKAQARHFREALALIQEIRQGVQRSRSQGTD